MKRTVLKIGGLSMASLLALSSMALVASAMEKTGMMSGDAMQHSADTPSSMMMMHPPAPMILTISNDGKGRLRGVVASVSATSITVATWGGMWTVNAVSDTQMLPARILMSEIKVGDYVGVMGTVSEDGPTMTATIIRDWTQKHDAMMKKDSMMKDDHIMASTSDAMMNHDKTGTSSDKMMH